MTQPLTASAIRWRYLVLVALRWLPVGLAMPVFILLPLARGLSLAELGVAASMQGFIVLLLELPTGGLADSVGRRRVLLLGSIVAIASTVLFIVADSFIAFGAVFLLQGVHRALDSGPLEAWFVDETLATDPEAQMEGGLSAAGVVLGIAIAGGALLSGILVAIAPIPGVDPLIVPVIVALVLQGGGLLAIVALMTETRQGSAQSARATVRAVPGVIRDGVGLLRRSRILSAIVAVEITWGLGMVAFESLFPVRLVEILGDAASAAAVAGPAASAAWLVSAGGAALVPWFGRRIGIAATAAMLRLAQAAAVVGIGLATGLAGALVAYLACYLAHGASNPAHMTLLHRQAGEAVRATVVSLNSMAAQTAGAIGIIVLTSLAGATSLTTAILVGAAILALGAPFYLPAWRDERASTPKAGSAAVA